MHDPSLVHELYENDSRPSQKDLAECEWEECTIPDMPAPLWILPPYAMPDGHYHWRCRVLHYRQQREKL